MYGWRCTVIANRTARHSRIHVNKVAQFPIGRALSHRRNIITGKKAPMSMHRQLLTNYFMAGIAAAKPALRLPMLLPTTPAKGRTIVLGAGKAAAEMAKIASECLAGEVFGCVVTRYGHNVADAPDNIQVIEANHPIPGKKSRLAGRTIRCLAERAASGDRVIFLISGGGSALLCDPLPGITLAQKMVISDWLVRSGAPIQEINLVRRHMSNIKGGRLAAAAAAAAELMTFVVSDVVGDDLSLVASGPTIATPFEPEVALEILEHHEWKISPGLASAIRGNAPPKVPDHPVHPVATNRYALQKIEQLARKDGWNVALLGGELTGNASDIGREHAIAAAAYAKKPGKHLLLSGGELTVMVKASGGRGGPNLEYLAGLMAGLAADAPVEALAGDTDGIDGTQDNAGGYFCARWRDQAIANGHPPDTMLKMHLTYDMFRELGGLIMTGPTRTNVNDLRLIAVQGQA